MRPGDALCVPRRRQAALWSESWEAPERRIRDLGQRLEGCGASVVSGGSFDRWDLEVRRGRFGSARLLMAIEEYPHGRQLVRWRYWPRFSILALLLATGCAGLALPAARDDAIVVAAVLAVCAAAVLIRTLRDAAAAMGTIARELTSTTTITTPATDLVVAPENSGEPDVTPALR